jgi:hypothetical protein
MDGLIVRRTPVRRLGRATAALALVVYAAGAGGSLTTTDAVVTFDVTRNLVEHGSAAMSGDLLGMAWHQGPDGRHYAPFGIGQSIVNIPPYLAARLVMALGIRSPGKPDTLPKAAVALSQTIVAAGVVWVTFLLGAVITRAPVPAALGALTLAFGSILWPYSGFGFNQPLAALLLLAAVHEAVVGAAGERLVRIARAGIWIGLALLTRHEMALAAVPVGAWLALTAASPAAASRRVLAFAPGLLAGAAAWLAYNLVRFANPFESGYLNDPVPAFGAGLGAGLAGLLVSPGASLFLYSPMAIGGVAGLARMSAAADVRRPAWLLMALVAVFTIFYASLGNWIGGRSYGSRYLVVVLPLLAVGWSYLLSVWPPRVRRAAAAVMLVAGAAIQLPGVLVDYSKVSQAAGGSRTMAERQWSWSASPLALNATALARALPENVAYVTGRRTPPPVQPASGDDDRGFAQQFAFSLDVWWLYLFYLGGLSRAAVLSIAIGTAAAVVWLARVVSRRCRDAGLESAA